MTTARKDLINENVVQTYHITTRCVRRCWLLDNDSDTEQDFSHRKKWLYEYLQLFSQAFCIDVGAYAIMSNHYHLILTNRPDLREKLTDSELAYRWLLLHPTSESKRKKRLKPTEEEINDFIKVPKKIKRAKEVLSCISEFMKRLNQRISRRANQEDGYPGRFWEARFNSQVLADDAAILTCMTYVDLNPIRAQITNDLAESKYTSAFDRANAETAKKNITAFNQEIKSKGEKITYKQKEALSDQYNTVNASKWLAKIQRNATEKTRPILRMNQNDYFELLDFTGREIRKDKPGFIPNRISTLLDTMDINHEEWISQIKNYGKWYYRILGHANSIKKILKDTGQKWFAGTKQNSRLYKQQPQET